MRLVMMGTGPFAVPLLGALVQSRHEVLVVVSRPFRGRRGTPPPAMHTAAMEANLELWTPDTVNHADSQARLTELSADLLVVCDYGEILRPATLATTRLGGINLHGSLLPRYRGAAPVQWAVLNGDTETGNTVIQMTPGLDAGPCLGQERLAIDPDETAGELEQRLALAGAKLAARVVDLLAADCAEPVPQDATQACKAPRLAKSDGQLDWSRPATQLKNRVRAMHPWPRAFSYLVAGDSPTPLRLVIDRVSIATAAQYLPPGQVAIEAGKLLVGTGDHPLELCQVQPAGKRAMPGGDFARGYVRPGAHLVWVDGDPA